MRHCKFAHTCRTGLLGIVVCAAMCLISTGGCDRPFVPPRLPEINIVEPNPNTIHIRRAVEIRAVAESFREISHLERDGERMFFDENKGQWVDTLSLDPGINEFVITAFDVEQVAGSSMVQMTYLRPTVSDDAPRLPSPWRLGGHTATLLNDGSVLVTGGSSSSTGSAFRDAFLLPEGATEFEKLEAELTFPRFGHSANLLPDGRVLFLGGGTTGALASVNQLVTSAEVYNPITRQFSELVFEGTPIERFEHVAFVSQENSGIVIDVFGGIGRTDSQSNILGTRRDFRTFVLREEVLTSLSAEGETLSEIEAAQGIAAVPMDAPAPGEADRFLVSGSHFLESGQADVNFTIDFSSTPVKIELLPGHIVPRTQHAAVSLQPGLIAFFGGFQGSNLTTLGSTEVYLESADNFFSLDHVLSIIPRRAHTATKLRSERILLLGGFNLNGQAHFSSQFVDWRATP